MTEHKNENIKSYAHYISLGHFCSVALELERMGLRSASYPFDWLITPDMRSVRRMIETDFEVFLNEDMLVRDAQKPSVYINRDTGFSFVHDFKRGSSLRDQLPAVKEKYARRIDRFFNDITEPTLFIRYISDQSTDDEGRFRDLVRSEEDYEDIIKLIRSYNPDNDILWIANDTVHSDVIPDIKTVPRDLNDTVARRPFDSLPELYRMLMEVDYPGREENLKIYREKEKRRKSLSNRIRNRISSLQNR